MTSNQLLEQIKNPRFQKLGKSPVVVLPLKTWQALEDYFEDLEIEQSRRFAKKISRARSEKRLYTAQQIKKLIIA